ncbi:uncharacterized protein AAES06_018318 [Glossophaga mutica]
MSCGKRDCLHNNKLCHARKSWGLLVWKSEKSAVGAQRPELTAQHGDLGSTSPSIPHWFLSKWLSGVYRGQKRAQTSSFLHPLHRARAEKTPLTIQYGVTVSHGSYVKCCVKTETMGCHENALGSGLNSQNHKSGHLDKEVKINLEGK